MINDERIQRVIDDEIESIRADINDAIEGLADECESPIELILGTRLLFISPGYGPGRSIINLLWPYGSPDGGPGGGISLTAFQIAIIPQWKSGDYRADFLVLFAAPRARSGGFTIKRFVVECDGHDFHEKTKEQAARDKARDRYFASLGCQVFRYTGSEIHRGDDDLLRDLEKAIWCAVEEGFNI